MRRTDPAGESLINAVPMRILLLFITTFFSFLLPAQEQDSTYMFRLLLRDKGESGFSVDNPGQFLSQKAIERRIRQGIAVDDTDLPIAASYLSQVKNTGAEVIAQSKWVKTITIATKQYDRKEQLAALPFVDSIQLVYKGLIRQIEEDTLPANILPVKANTPLDEYYGEGFAQIALHNGNLLHEAGYKGAGLSIAVFDGGFHNADKIEAFDQERIAAVKTFSHLGAHPFRIRSEHGTRVLSCMLSNKENTMVGTAPEASYYLFCSEVDNCEFPVEEDYWIAGLEYADSLGVNITTTSLGYTHFDNDAAEMNHQTADLDGEHVLMSRAAGMAAEKGILVLNAAGNEGNKSWGTLSIPSDAKNILTVGAVDSRGELASFTPTGPTADGRVKPDVMGIGVATSLIAADGSLVQQNGTSYSTPVIAGLAACLWQAFPEWSNKELISRIQQSADRYHTPDNRYGYGIPDVFRAYEQNSSSIREEELTYGQIRQIGNYLFIDVEAGRLNDCKLSIYSPIGRLIESIHRPEHASVNVNYLPRGMYIALLEGQDIRQSCKFIIR